MFEIVKIQIIGGKEMRTENLEIKVEKITNKQATKRLIGYKKKIDSLMERAANEKNNGSSGQDL